MNHFSLYLDEIFYPRYKKLQILKPVFIIGIPRSGTTFLFRSLAFDKENFSYFHLWEILFAPSIFQKKLIILILKIDNRVYNPLKSFSLFISAKLSKKLDSKHYSRLNLPEEDELILFHIFSTAFLTFLFPNDIRSNRFTHFETELAKNEKDKILGFYKKCLQKHLYVYGPEKTFLSKNPTFTAKIPSLKRHFSDARFIYLQRNPEESISSFISLARSLYKITYKFDNSPLVQQNIKDLMIWYKTVWESDFAESENWFTLNFKDLTNKPKEVVKALYPFLNLEIESQMEVKLEALEKKQSKRKSGHQYTDLQKQVAEHLKTENLRYLKSDFKE